MSNKYQDAQVRPDIHHGNATVCGTEKGWALPGDTMTRSEAVAKMVAIRMSNIMDRAGVGK